MELKVISTEYGPGIISGNGHTHRGRFQVYFPAKDSYRFQSLLELEEISPFARVWLDGFLAGQEPSIYEYLGVDAREHEPEEVEYERWRDFCSRFRVSGESQSFEKRPIRPLLLTPIENADVKALNSPWVVAGEQVWTFTDGEWQIPESPPLLRNEFMVETVCLPRLAHSMQQMTDGWSVCIDCYWSQDLT